jgi:hypothetical protein
MMALNATHLFERKTAPWPALSESFWTSLFAMFALHIGAGLVPKGRLTIWHCANGSGGKWYLPRAGRPALNLTALTLDRITVEPRALSKPWPGSGIIPPADVGGFSPDLVMISQTPEGPDHFIIVENKVTSQACLMDNQVENYPVLARWLTSRQASFDLLLLKSVGCCKALYDQARSFQNENWGGRFGILLWEEVFREMRRTEFAPGGLPVETWRPYTAALETDCIQP